jgi:hypothetical protein
MADEQDVFRKDVGTWDAELEIRPEPGQPPQRSQGVSVGRLIAGGRWLVVDFKNQTTGFEGHGVYGWDAAKKKYVGTWVDDMRASLTVLEGDWDPAQRTMTFHAERWREVTTTVDDDTQIYRLFFPGPDGKDFEMMTVTYRRRR